MERRPAVESKVGVGILHVCQVKDHHQERSDNNIDCSPSHLAHYIKKTVTACAVYFGPPCIHTYVHTYVHMHIGLQGPSIKYVTQFLANFNPLPLSYFVTHP